MAGGRYVVLIPSVCTPPEDFERLAAALSQIAGEAGQRRKEEFPVSGHTEIPAYAMSPREAFFAPRERVGIEESLGLICAETVSPYPPGTVLIAPGERIDGNILGSLRKKSINTIAVVREK
jgi:arginine/lysine/ornithine decarboxylase